MEKNSKKSIIIGVTSLLLVTLLLVGLTYAYYRTRIIGNESTDPSISVTSKKLEIVYSDESPVLNMEGLIKPGFTFSKTFYVENTGSETVDYVVYLEDVINEYTRTQDWTYSITCLDSNGSSCTGVDETEYPTLSEKIIDASIESKVKQTYTIEIKYADLTDVDQSDDMGATLEGKIQIYAAGEVVDIEGTIAGASDGDYVQINSVKKVSQIVDGKYRLPAVEAGEHTLSVRSSDGTLKGSAPLFIEGKSEIVVVNITSIAETLGVEINANQSKWDTAPEGSLLYALKNNQPSGSETTTPGIDASTANEARLVATEDDFGTSYVYRGVVENNYVTFASMCWRIVRIKGNGSIKLILEDKDNTCEEMAAMTSTVGSYNLDKGDYNIADGVYGYQENDNLQCLIDDYLGYEGGMADEFLTYQTTLAKKIDPSIVVEGQEPTIEQVKNTLASKLEVGDWCNTEGTKYDEDYQTILTQDQVNDKITNTQNFYYDSYVRLKGRNPKEPTLKCKGTTMSKFRDNTDMYVGTLTADEIVYAGAGNVGNVYYLRNDYLYEQRATWVSLSPSHFNGYNDTMFIVPFSGCLDNEGVGQPKALRPSVSLKSNTTIVLGGEGTMSNPYVIG